MKGNSRLNTLNREPQQSTVKQSADNILRGLREPSNDDAWSRLFTKSQLKVFKIAKQSGLSWWEAQDLFEEVMVVVVREICKSFNGTDDSALIHWVCGIARHKANAFCRERWRLSRLNVALLDSNGDEAGLEEERIDRIKLLEQLVEEARQETTPGDFASFTLRWFNGASAKEAGRILNKSAKAVYRGAERFLQALRKAGRKMIEQE